MNRVSAEKFSVPGAADALALCDRIRARLDAERRRLQEEIRAYPTPIPRCDQQFNALIERREQLFADLARLEHIAAGTSANGETEAVAAFVDSTSFLGREERQQLKSVLREPSIAPRRRSSTTESEHPVASRADSD